MPLTVAIASEYDPYDGEIYRFLLEGLLGVQVVKWTGTFSFNGYKSVAGLAHPFLTAAANQGVGHAVLAVDNDGGAVRRPEHAAECSPVPFDIEDDDSCRDCWLGQATPLTWTGKTCIGVPVQTVETWLLAIRGHAFPRAPERYYGRPYLKRFFWGKPQPPVATRVQLALAELRKPHALGVLAQRPSFRRFALRLVGWP